MSIMHKVFVYGTLKRGGPNHSWILDGSKGTSEFLCEAETVEKYPLIIGTRYNIPFVLDAPNIGHNVRGELYEVNEPMLKHLDVLEDHPQLYVREMRKVRTCYSNNSKTDIVSSWIYLIKTFHSGLLHEPYLSEYTSNGSHGKPYIERYLRDSSGYNVRTEVQGTLNK